MTRRKFSKGVQWLFAGLLCSVAFSGSASAQGYHFSPEHRRPVETTLHDLNQIASESPYDRHQRERYDNAIRDLREFGERLHQGGYFDKPKLDQAIAHVQTVIDHNRMSNRAHDILMRDATQLRELRQHFEDRNRYH